LSGQTEAQKNRIKTQSTSIFDNFSKVEKMKKNHKKHCWNVENGIFWRIWVCKPAGLVLIRWEIKFHPKCI